MCPSGSRPGRPPGSVKPSGGFLRPDDGVSVNQRGFPGPGKRPPGTARTSGGNRPCVVQGPRWYLTKKLRLMPVGTILLVILVLLLLGVAPAWPYSRDFGWGPSGIVGVLVVVLLILLLMGRI